MDENGYISLTDFGFGRLGINRNHKKKSNLEFTSCYCPPEYLKMMELTRMSDWY